MIKSIGLIDYDALVQRRYVAPNYDLGLTYAYLKSNPNISIRLITSLTGKNLDKYDQIYLFKISKYLPHPSSRIKDYYKRDIVEYGSGFMNRPPRPYFTETMYLTPDFTCYNPILQFSVEKPKHPMAWKTKGAVKSTLYTHIRLYEEVEGEYLRRDLNLKNHYLAIHDDPARLLNDTKALEILEELWANKHHTFFTQPLDISLLNNTNILERVITDSNMATLRHNLIISNINENALWFINYYLTHKCKKTDVLVLVDKGMKCDYYLRLLLQLNYFNNKSNYLLRLRPYYDKEIIMVSPLTHCIYRFLYETPYLMSYYEYVFYMGCKNIGVPEKLIRTDEEIYEFILSKYGMPDLVKELEDWLISNPDYEEQIFIGGTSKYEKCRKKYYNPKTTKYAFNVSST